MERGNRLYQAICREAGKKSLSDDEIHKIVLFLQRRLSQPGNTVDFSVGELIHINSNTR